MQQGAGNVAVPATGGVAIRYTQDSDTEKEAIMQQGERLTIPGFQVTCCIAY